MSRLSMTKHSDGSRINDKTVMTTVSTTKHSDGNRFSVTKRRFCPINFLTILIILKNDYVMKNIDDNKELSGLKMLWPHLFQRQNIVMATVSMLQKDDFVLLIISQSL